MERPLRILLVEDEVMIGICLELELKQAGNITCRLAATGEEAIEMAAGERPDLVVMDIQLAGKFDGIEAAERIRTDGEIPVVFMTGYSDSAVEERARTLNPLGYFVKPVRVYDLMPIIDTLSAL